MSLKTKLFYFRAFMKTLMILSAIPASGKSTWAKRYAETHPNCFIVSSDQIRYEVTHSFNDHSQQKLVWELFSKRIHEYGKNDNCTVILDALNDLNCLREKYVKENPEFDRYVLVLFPINDKRSAELNGLRTDGTMVPPEILKSLIEKFEPLDEKTKSLFDEIIEVEW